MYLTTEAIVLNSLKYGDDKLIVDMLTEQQGRLSFIVKVPKTARGKMKRQLFQPLTIIQIEFDFRQNSELQRLRDIRLSTPYLSIPISSSKLSIAFFLSEFLSYATRKETNGNSLFSFVRNSLLYLDTTETNFANFHIVFSLRLTRFLGVFPDTGAYHEGCYFDLREGIFTASTPSHSDYLAPTEAQKFNILMRLSFATMHLFAVSHDDRNRIVGQIIRYYQLHIPSFPNLRSFEVLQSMS